MSSYLKPHSSEWFTALKRINSVQAGQTRQILSAAGRDDVCSICGDNLAADYKMASAQMMPDSIATLRLCNDCLKIRCEMYSEDFVLLTN